MDEKLELELKAKYPLVFHEMFNSDIRRSCMAGGIECGTGWYGIIEEAASKLEPLIEQWIKDNPKPVDDECWSFPCAAQIKQKFAELRFYLNSGTEEMHRIAGEAEAKSHTICEGCGKTGAVKGRGWVYIACEECEAKYEQNRNKANG